MWASVLADVAGFHAELVIWSNGGIGSGIGCQNRTARKPFGAPGIGGALGGAVCSRTFIGHTGGGAAIERGVDTDVVDRFLARSHGDGNQALVLSGDHRTTFAGIVTEAATRQEHESGQAQHAELTALAEQTRGPLGVRE